MFILVLNQCSQPGVCFCLLTKLTAHEGATVYVVRNWTSQPRRCLLYILMCKNRSWALSLISVMNDIGLSMMSDWRGQGIRLNVLHISLVWIFVYLSLLGMPVCLSRIWYRILRYITLGMVIVSYVLLGYQYALSKMPMICRRYFFIG